MKQYRRFMLLLAMMSAATFGMAQDWADVPENRFAVTVKIDSAIASEPQKLYMYSSCSRWDRYLGMTAVMTQVPVPTAIWIATSAASPARR